MVWRETGAVRNARPSRGQAAAHPEETEWKESAKPRRSWGGGKDARISREEMAGRERGPRELMF
jgi:hypothetical protein